ncbi:MULTISPECIES: hypothetical protein [unclassified Streptomyces]|nr:MULTISPECIES: hypothetical protein [unclassified Streptomyces]
MAIYRGRGVPGACDLEHRAREAPTEETGLVPLLAGYTVDVEGRGRIR